MEDSSVLQRYGPHSTETGSLQVTDMTRNRTKRRTNYTEQM